VFPPAPPEPGKLRPVDTPAGRLSNPAAPIERMELIHGSKATDVCDIDDLIATTGEK
jgi:hypothetical protein